MDQRLPYGTSYGGDDGAEGPERRRKDVRRRELDVRFKDASWSDPTSPEKGNCSRAFVFGPSRDGRHVQSGLG